jgi:thiosulfate dehydrogenase (quinone) large subunit
MVQQQKATLQWGALAIVVLAGAWTMFHLIWNFAGQTSDDYWGIALLILFLLALLVAFMQYFQERSVLKAEASTERFPEPAISKFFLASEGSAAVWFVVRMNIGSQ